MKQALTTERMTEQDQQISETIEREQVRLRNFIRRRVDDESDADDILQDVFYELVEAYRLMQPIEQVGAWLFRVARNRIIDRFRKRKTKPETLQEEVAVAEDGEFLMLEELLPSDRKSTRLNSSHVAISYAVFCLKKKKKRKNKE